MKPQRIQRSRALTIVHFSDCPLPAPSFFLVALSIMSVVLLPALVFESLIIVLLLLILLCREYKKPNPIPDPPVPELPESQPRAMSEPNPSPTSRAGGDPGPLPAAPRSAAQMRRAALRPAVDPIAHVAKSSTKWWHRSETCCRLNFADKSSMKHLEPCDVCCYV